MRLIGTTAFRVFATPAEAYREIVLAMMKNPRSIGLSAWATDLILNAHPDMGFVPGESELVAVTPEMLGCKGQSMFLHIEAAAARRKLMPPSQGIMLSWLYHAVASPPRTTMLARFGAGFLIISRMRDGSLYLGGCNSVALYPGTPVVFERKNGRFTA